MKKQFFLLMGLLCLFGNLTAQVPRYKYKGIAIGLVPGFGTNGIDGGKYRNGFALNVISGYSGGTEFLEIAGISNFSKGEVSGIQLAGFVNIVGGNALEFPKKPRKQPKLLEARQKAQLHGFQFAGFMNAVTGDAYAWQLAGGFNINARHTTGIQMAGVSNLSYKSTTGFQFAGLSNFSGKNMKGMQLALGVNHGNLAVTGVQLAGVGNLAVETMTGLQIAGLANIAQEELLGAQLAVFNYARVMKGPHSWPGGGKPGLQIGLVNFAHKMDGIQVGLINIAGQSHGAHFGLINIFSNAGRVNQRSGPAYGLLNFGDYMHFRASTNELFGLNLSVATGNSQDALVKGGYLHHLTQNSLIYSRNFGAGVEGKDKPRWAFGYGIEKYIYAPKIGIPAQFKFLNYGVQFMHVNWDKQLEKDLSLLTRLRITVGGKPVRVPVLSSLYWYIGLTLNGFVYDPSKNFQPNFGKLAEFGVGDYQSKVWIGYVVGTHFYKQTCLALKASRTG
ncbi:MAG: LA_2272 family surface repeat-containing protein [Flammeovirgaceae bacterium]